MGSLGSLFGFNGGVNGTGVTPQGANIVPGTNAGQLAGSYGGNQSALASQQALLAALQGQNGLGNQSQVYNQLQGVVNGTGYNPAQAQLAQATGQNIQNQAALMAGQRGAGSNVGLIARQAAQQGAATQQGAIGQAAALQAQQSLNALGQAGNIANTQVANQMAGVNANTAAQQGEQGILQGANTAANQANVGMQSNINQTQASLAGAQMSGISDLAGSSTGTSAAKGVGGGLNALGSALGLAAAGGVAGKDFGLYADGGDVAALPPPPPVAALPPPPPGSVPEGPQSTLGKALSARLKEREGISAIVEPAGFDEKSRTTIGINGPGRLVQPFTPPKFQQPIRARPGHFIIEERRVHKSPYPGGPELAPQWPVDPAHLPSWMINASEGARVPGKASVPGNSYSNDKVKALLSPGELVVDRETMADKGKAGQAARFLAAVIEAKKRGKK